MMVSSYGTEACGPRYKTNAYEYGNMNFIAIKATKPKRIGKIWNQTFQSEKFEKSIKFEKLIYLRWKRYLIAMATVTQRKTAVRFEPALKGEQSKETETKGKEQPLTTVLQIYFSM